MKKVFIFLFLISAVVFAQRKDDLSNRISIKESFVNKTPSNFFSNFFNPQNFQMHHSFGLSYSTFGGNGIALGLYTNSMYFKVSDELFVRLDASIVNSPYNTIGHEYSEMINGIYLSRFEVNYKPSKNMNFILQYRGGPGSYSPYGYYNWDYSPFRMGRIVDPEFEK